MHMEKELYVFICEDAEVARKIIGAYFEPGQVTYANMMASDKRGAIVTALEDIENEPVQAHSHL